MVEFKIAVLRDRATEKLSEDPYSSASFYGAHEFLRTCGLEFEVVEVSELIENSQGLDRYSLCLTPDLIALAPGTVDTLRGWVKAGGILIATGFFARMTPKVPIEIDVPPLKELGQDLFGVDEATITGVPEPDIGVYMGLSPVHHFFRDVRPILPILGVNPVLRAKEGAEKVGFLLNREERRVGDLLIVNRYGEGLTVRLSARIFRTMGLLLSSCQWKELLWPGLRKAVNRVYLSLDRDGWSSVPVYDQLCKLVYNVMDTLMAERNGLGIPKKWFWPHHNGEPVKFVTSIVHDVDSPSLEWIRKTDRLDGELGVGLAAAYYFLCHTEKGEYPHVYEPNIFDENFVQEIKDLTEAGREVTVHGQVTDKQAVFRERDAFINATGIKPTGVRMHYVFHSAERLQNYQEAGYEYDLSFYDNYHRGPSFFTFSTHPSHPLDPDKGEAMGILTGGPVIEDGVLYSDIAPRPWGYHGTWGKEAVAWGKFFIDMVESENGFLALNWHTRDLDAVDTVRRWDFSKLLRELVSYIKQKSGHLFMTPAQIFRWWRIRESAKVRLSYDGQDTATVTIQNPTEGVIKGLTFYVGHPVKTVPELKTVGDEDGFFILLPPLEPGEELIFELEKP